MTDRNPLQQFPPLRDVIVILLLTLALTFFFALVGGLVGMKTGLFLIEGIIIVPALIYSLIFKYPLKKTFRLHGINLPIAGVSIIFAIGISVVVDEFDRLFQLIFPMPEILKEMMEKSLQIASLTDLMIIGFSAVILAAVLEELLFRGFVQNSFEQSFDITRAVMATAIIFAVMHLNPWWTVQFTFFGIFLGVMAWKSNSVIPSMIVHFINNGLALLFSNIEPAKLSWYAGETHVKLPILILAVVVSYFGMRFFYLACDNKNANEVANDEIFEE